MRPPFWPHRLIRPPLYLTRSSAELNRLLHVWTVLKPCHGTLSLLPTAPYVLTAAYDITTDITIVSSSPPVRSLWTFLGRKSTSQWSCRYTLCRPECAALGRGTDGLLSSSAPVQYTRSMLSHLERCCLCPCRPLLSSTRRPARVTSGCGGAGISRPRLSASRAAPWHSTPPSRSEEGPSCLR